MATLDREIDRLYALPLEEFTAGRNALARRLKSEGDNEAAEQVAALAKPSLPVWAINQLARQEKARMRNASGRGRKAPKGRRSAPSPAVAPMPCARPRPTNAKRSETSSSERACCSSRPVGPASRPVLERIRSTLGAAALAESARSTLKAGRLTDELQMSGFEALAGIEPAPREKAKPRDELAERRQKKAEIEQERRRLEKRARDLNDRAEKAEQSAERAEETASEAESSPTKAAGPRTPLRLSSGSSKGRTRRAGSRPEDRRDRVVSEDVHDRLGEEARNRQDVDVRGSVHRVDGTVSVTSPG